MSGLITAAQMQTLFQRAMALHQNGQLQEAQAGYRQLLRWQPKNFDCLHLLGVIAFQTGSFREAVDLIGGAIALHPSAAAFYCNRANALLELAQTAAALADYDKAIGLDPGYAQAYNNRGSALQDLNRLEAALASYDKAIALQPGYANAFNNRGRVLHELGQLEAAIASYDLAISTAPDFAQAHNNRGNALLALRRLDDALASFDQAISAMPDYAEAHNNRGNALRERKQPDAAIASFGKAIALRPAYAEAYSNRGNAFRELNRLDDALADFDKALSLKPEFPEAYSNRGSVLHELKRFEDAHASFDAAIARRPDFADAHWNKALTSLLTGDFENGWPLYQWGLPGGQRGERREFGRPLWIGNAALQDKTVLLHSEQGLGDTIQFSRYAKGVAALGARVILEVPGSLAGLLRGLEGVSEIIIRGSALPDFDYHCPLLSLPLAFKTTRDTIPAAAHLARDADKARRWAEKLGARTGPRIGLVWKGNSDHRRDDSRSIALSRLLPHLPGNYAYVSLQKELPESDRALLRTQGNVRHFGEALVDFTDTAALCDLMDVIVSVDTSVAHLAGALGKPTCLLLSHVPDWRWLLDRTDSPWYPSMRLYRQPAMGDWDHAIQQAAADLKTVPHAAV